MNSDSSYGKDSLWTNSISGEPVGKNEPAGLATPSTPMPPDTPDTPARPGTSGPPGRPGTQQPQPPRPKELKIALVMGLDDFYERGIARGLVRYAKSRPSWKVCGHGWMFGGLADLATWKGNAIVARIESPEAADFMASLGVPVVDVAGAYSRAGFRYVTNDDFMTGYKAAIALKARGFSSFAFAGVEKVRWSHERQSGFLAALGKETCIGTRHHGAPEGLQSLYGPGPSVNAGLNIPHPGQKGCPGFERSLVWWESGYGTMETLGSFLHSLPRPTGLFACNDTAGLRIVECCARTGLQVPADIAILGVDDEDILCELASPSLSSIGLDLEGIGYKAGQVLDEILNGAGPSVGSRLTVPPGSVVERETTRTHASEDPVVSKAMTFIQIHAGRGIDAQDVVAASGVSRRTVESRIKQETGKTIHQAILEAKLESARRLLAGTDMPLDEVASRSGFCSLQRFHEGFKSRMGTSPGTWRKKAAWKDA